MGGQRGFWETLSVPYQTDAFLPFFSSAPFDRISEISFSITVEDDSVSSCSELQKVGGREGLQLQLI